MAITILTQPTSIIAGIQVMPAFNNISYTVVSTNNTQCKFKYIADIYVNGVNIKRLKLFPNPSGQAEFKINRVLQDYLSNEPQINVVGFTTDNTRILEYQVKFGEEYDNTSSCDGIPTDFVNLTNSAVAYSWNGAMQYKEFLDYFNLPTTYTLDAAIPGKFLTHSPDTILIGMGEQAELSFLALPGYGYNADSLVIDKYDSNNTITGTQTITNPNTSVTNHNKMFQTVGVGPENINNSLSTTFIDMNTFKYRVYLKNATSPGPLNNNPFMHYMSGPGTNSWTYTNVPACGSHFGIESDDMCHFVIPDVSCTDTMSIQYTDGTFIPGVTYSVIVDINTLTNPSGNDWSLTINLGGNLSTPITSTGIQTVTVVCGGTGTFELIGYMDADTGGFGTHAFTIDLVEIVANGGNRTSEYKYYEIDRRKTKYDHVRFRWLNRLGGFDSYCFNLLSSTTTNIVRTEYDRLMKTNYRIGDRGRTLISVTATDKVSVNSNWLTPNESYWIEELYTSLNVFIQDTNNIYNIFKIAPDSTSGKPDLFLSCPLNQEDQLSLDNQSVFLDTCGMNVGLNGIHTVGVINSNTLSVGGLSGTLLSDCGIVYLSGARLSELPIIITSQAYENKIKGKTKNINQTIEFEFAFNKNIQRN